MCCNLRAHVIVISIVHLSLTLLTGLSIELMFSEAMNTINKAEAHSETMNSGVFFWGVAVGVLLDLVPVTLCLIGALKNNKCLLIPFIIVEGLQILACTGGLGFFVSEATQQYGAPVDFAVMGLLFFGPPLMLGLGLTIYFLTIGIKFYQELSCRVVGGRTEGFVLQPYLRFRQEEEVSTVYVPPVTQNVMCANQHQPPSYAETQQEKAQHNDLNMKNPA